MIKITNKYRIIKKGWDNENEVIPIILLSKSERDKLRVEKTQPVKVIHNINKDVTFESFAIVDVQFKDYLSIEDCCSVNTVLGKRLNLNVDDKVEITKQLTESEYKKFMKDIQQAIFFGY